MPTCDDVFEPTGSGLSQLIGVKHQTHGKAARPAFAHDQPYRAPEHTVLEPLQRLPGYDLELFDVLAAIPHLFGVVVLGKMRSVLIAAADVRHCKETKSPFARNRLRAYRGIPQL